MKKRFFSVLFLFVLANTFIFAKNSIKIISPRNDSNISYYNESELAQKTTIKGEVSPNCTSIRVIWTTQNKNNLFDYLVNNKNKGNFNDYKASKYGYKIDDFTLKQYKKGSTTFEYNCSTKFENLDTGSNYYLFLATFSDGSTATCTLDLYVYYAGGAEMGKPVIYLYPEQTTDISVSVKPAAGVTVSIPEMNDQWNVTASPDGVITDKQDGKEYPYLFWESLDDSKEIDLSEGFVVKTSKLESFFNEKLKILGLNKKEIADFNEFWIPELQGKEYVFITFYSQEKIDEQAPLSISPTPDSIIRVYFDHKKLDRPIKTKKQKLQSAKRKGFSVIEWGGKRYK